MADLDLANLEEFEQDVLANPQYHDLSENDMAALAAVNRRIREGTVADTNVATVPSRAAKELELVPSYTLKDLTGTDLAKLVESAAKKQSLSLFFSLLVEDCRDLIYVSLQFLHDLLLHGRSKLTDYLRRSYSRMAASPSRSSTSQLNSHGSQQT